MSLVETVTGELLHQVENKSGRRFFYSTRGSAVHEHLALLGHLLGFLLSHGASKNIGTAQRVSRQRLSDLHDLLLVENDSVGGLEYLRQIRVQVFHCCASLLAVDEIVDHARLQRSRAEQRNQSDDITESIRPQSADQVFHAARFELEHGGGRARFNEGIGVGVVGRDGTDFQKLSTLLAAPFVDSSQRRVDDGQGAQPEKVELDQADGFDVVLVELGDQGGRILLTI